MMRMFVPLLLLVMMTPVQAAIYSGCEDPAYKAYVNKRLAFYAELEKESFEEAQLELAETPLDDMFFISQASFLYHYTIRMARFGAKETALKFIKAYESNWFSTFTGFMGDDRPHTINIARGWLALNDGDEDKAVEYLLEAANVGGSPILGSFGPDVTLLRALYQRGHTDAVLEYLKRSDEFWTIESAVDFKTSWRKLIANNCAIQFQFYDTTSIEELGF